MALTSEGATSLKYVCLKTPDMSELREKLSHLNLGEIALQQFGSDRDLLIKVERQEGNEQAQVDAIQKIKGTLGLNVEYRKVENGRP